MWQMLPFFLPVSWSGDRCKQEQTIQPANFKPINYRKTTAGALFWLLGSYGSRDLLRQYVVSCFCFFVFLFSIINYQYLHVAHMLNCPTFCF